MTDQSPLSEPLRDAYRAAHDLSSSANELAFKWLNLHSRHAPTCRKVTDRIMPQEPRSGLCKDYGGRYRTEQESSCLPCTCGLDEALDALCQAAG